MEFWCCLLWVKPPLDTCVYGFSFSCALFNPMTAQPHSSARKKYNYNTHMLNNMTHYFFNRSSTGSNSNMYNNNNKRNSSMCFNLFSRSVALTMTSWFTAMLLLLSMLSLFDMQVSAQSVSVVLVGGSGQQGYFDGQGTVAALNGPQSLAADAQGNLIIADSANNRIRKLSWSSGSGSAGWSSAMSTLAGSGVAGWLDGRGTVALFNNPQGLAVDQARN